MNPLNGVVSPGGGSGGAGVSGLTTADGGTALADNVIVRGDGTTGIQGSLPTITDAGAIKVADGTEALPSYSFTNDPDTGFFLNTVGFISPTIGGTTVGAWYSSGFVNYFDSGAYGSTRIGLAGGLTFSSANNPFNDKAAGLVYGGASGVVRVSDGSTGVGALLTAQVVEANTADSGTPNVLAVTESNKILTNEGTSAENYHTLPAATVGLVYEFVCVDANGIRIAADGTDRIYVLDTLSGAGGYISSGALMSNVTLKCVVAGLWYASSINGVWDIDGSADFDNTGLIT